MSCDTVYLYNDIFNECGAIIRTLLLNPTSIITQPTNTATNTANPFPVYETRDAYDADIINDFKGILVWYAHKYYSSMSSSDTPDLDGYRADAGFYVVPSFGDVFIIPNIEYKQMLAVTFDTNTDLDHDPYGSKITNFISVFVNNVYGTLERYGNELEVGDSRPLYTRIARITKGAIVPHTVYERRTVLIELRYCQCY